MKQILTCLSLLFSAMSLGQSMETYLAENFWHLANQQSILKKNAGKLTSAQTRILNKLIKDTILFVSDCGVLLEDFHFQDLDKDNDLDLIFEGRICPGFESESVIVWMNRNNKYEKALSTHGRFSKITIGDEIIVYEYPCCIMLENSLVAYSIQHDEIIYQTGLTLFHNIGVNDEDGKWLGLAFKPLKFEKDYEINACSEVNYIPKDSLGKHTLFGNNMIGVLPNPLSVKSFLSYQDSKGNTWLYCLIPNGQIRSELNLEYPILAWINERFCHSL